MKKQISLALLSLAATGAMAQSTSSVTLFGVVDAHARHLKNGSTSVTQLGSGGESTSRLGFRGVEDLGGGLKAGFWLESQLATDTGVAGATSGGVDRFWHRRSTVSLSGNWGELRAGRDTLPSWTALANFDVFGTVGVGSLANLYPDSAAFGSQRRVRADNSLAYWLPKLGGVYGVVTISPDEGADGAKYHGGRIGYQEGALNVTAAYGSTEVGLDDHQVTVAGGSYDFGVLKLHGVLQQTKFASAKNQLHYLGLTSRVGTAGTVKFSYARTKGDGVVGTTDWSAIKSSQLALGYVHDLSKRTAIYTTVSYLKNEGSARYTVGGIGGYSQLAGDNSRGVDIGIRHRF